MKVSEVTSGGWRSFAVPGLAGTAIWFYGPPVPSGDDPRLSVTAWLSIAGIAECHEIVAAKAMTDEVEPLVERAKSGLIVKVKHLLTGAAQE